MKQGEGGQRSARLRVTPRAGFTLGGITVPPGEERLIELHVARGYTRSGVSVPVHVLHGRREGPVLLVSAAIHGDELNGFEAVRRLLERPLLDKLRGTLLAVPVVNLPGFTAHARLLPDRRDLNRSFPGKARGSLTARLAHLFSEEVVARATHAIDLHTGALHRTNLPHLRGDLTDPETLRLAQAFAPPLLLRVRRWPRGTLREATRRHRIPLLVYEGGEALRFDEEAIRVAVRGVLGVMRALEMLPPQRGGERSTPLLADSSRWLRAPDSGILTTEVVPGQRLREGELVGTISDPLGATSVELRAHQDGVVIGMLRLPVVNEGDAVFHLARVAATEAALAGLRSGGGRA